MGRDTTTPSRSRTMGSGGRADHGDLGEAKEVEVGARVEEAEGPVDLEGLGTELQVEPLREHHLEHVPGVDVLLGHRHRRPVGVARHGPVPFRRCEPGLGHGHRPRGDPPAAVHRKLAHPLGRRLVGGGDLRLGPALSDHHVVDQHDPLAPVVERRQLADDHKGGIGVAEIVGGHVGEVLDLADHVVAEVADDPAMKGREVGQRRRLESCEQLLEGSQHPPTIPGGHRERAGGDHVAPPGHQVGERCPPDEGVAAPALSAFD